MAQGWVKTTKDTSVKLSLISSSSIEDNRALVFEWGLNTLAGLIAKDLFLPTESVKKDLEADRGLKAVKDGWEFSYLTEDKKYKFTMSKPKLIN